MAVHRNSLANIGKGRPPTGRNQYKVSLLPSADSALKKIDRSRGKAVERSLQLLRNAYAYLEDSEDPEIMAWCDEVEPILEAKRTGSFEDEESTAWIV